MCVIGEAGGNVDVSTVARLLEYGFYLVTVYTTGMLCDTGAVPGVGVLRVEYDGAQISVAGLSKPPKPIF